MNAPLCQCGDLIAIQFKIFCHRWYTDTMCPSISLMQVVKWKYLAGIKKLLAHSERPGKHTTDFTSHSFLWPVWLKFNLANETNLLTCQVTSADTWWIWIPPTSLQHSSWRRPKNITHIHHWTFWSFLPWLFWLEYACHQRTSYVQAHWKLTYQHPSASDMTPRRGGDKLNGLTATGSCRRHAQTVDKHFILRPPGSPTAIQSGS